MIEPRMKRTGNRRHAVVDEVGAFVQRVAAATPMKRIAMEREGVSVAVLNGLAGRLGISICRLHRIIGLGRTTSGERFEGARVAGAAGHAAIALAELLSRAEEIVAGSTSQRAEGFDVARWLGLWLEQPQPALGGSKPADLIGTPTGARVVQRALGALESAAFQ